MSAKDKAVAISLSGILLMAAVFVGFAIYLQADKPIAANQVPAPVVMTETKPPTVSELLTLVNAERASKGVAPLILDERLNKSAQQKTDDMQTNNYFDHVDKNGRHGYDIAHEYAPDICILPSENLSQAERTPLASEVFESWKNSKKHYDALVNPRYQYTGFGVNDTLSVEHFC